MKINLAFHALVLGCLLPVTVLAAICPACKATVYDDEKFCAACGKSLAAPEPTPNLFQHRYYGTDPNSSVYLNINGKNVLPDMGRGLLTVCSSPLEILRGAVVTCTKLNDGSSGPNTAAEDGLAQVVGPPLLAGVLAVGSVIGAISAVGDVCVGSLDVLSFGYVGNEAWKNNARHPYSWQRPWRGDYGGGVVY